MVDIWQVKVVAAALETSATEQTEPNNLTSSLWQQVKSQAYTIEKITAFTIFL